MSQTIENEKLNIFCIQDSLPITDHCWPQNSSSSPSSSFLQPIRPSASPGGDIVGHYSTSMMYQYLCYAGHPPPSPQCCLPPPLTGPLTWQATMAGWWLGCTHSRYGQASGLCHHVSIHQVVPGTQVLDITAEVGVALEAIR